MLVTYGRRSEVGVVGSRAVLGVEDGEVTAETALAVVVVLEVTRGLREAEVVEDIVVGVGSVEQLRHGSIAVRRRRRPAGAPVVLEVEIGARGAVVVLPRGAAAGVGLRNGVVWNTCVSLLSMNSNRPCFLWRKPACYDYLRRECVYVLPRVSV